MKYNTKTFIIKIKEKLGSKAENLDFSNVEYINMNERVNIICNKHGEFSPLARSLFTGRGCPKCKGTITHSEFIRRVEEAMGDYKFNKLDFSKTVYDGSHKNVTVICTQHGEFYPVARSLTTGRGCPKCKGLKDNVTFLEEMAQIWGKQYDFSKTSYKHSDEEVCVICPTHGEFYKKPTSLIKHQGCPECTNHNYTAWGLDKLINDENRNIECILYSLKFTHKESNEIFYKIGITTLDISTRFKRIKNRFNIEIIDLYKGTLYQCKIIENDIINKNKIYSYVPDNMRGGHTECFKIPILLDVN